MPNCSVEGCTNKSGHLFPKNNPALKRKWLKFVGLREHDVNVHSLICKTHFSEDAFEQSIPVAGLPPPRKRLRPNAVPTLKKPGGPSIPPRKTPLKSPKPALIIDEAVPACSSLKKINLAEVDLSSGEVYSDNQLARVIEKIKEKILKNVHRSSVFPKKWQNSNMFAGKPKIREGFPPFSMPCLVALAIEVNLKKMATPSQIVGFISQNFPCYKLTDPTWHGKVFETLETYRLFQKVSHSLTDMPKKTFYQFVPDKKTVLSSNVCEAFTDPFFDESKVDPSNSVVITQEECFPNVASECTEESRVDDFDDNVGLSHPEDEAASVSAVDVIAERAYENSESNEIAASILEVDEIQDDEKPNDPHPEGSSSSDEESLKSMTFFECSYCEFVAASTKTISAHVLRKHWNGENYCCAQCKYETPVKESLMDHKKTHRK